MRSPIDSNYTNVSVKTQALRIERYIEECLANMKRLQALAAAGIPDLDRVIVRRRREPARVAREGYGRNSTAVALERLQASTPLIAHRWLYRNRLWLFILEKTSCQAAGWTK